MGTKFSESSFEALIEKIHKDPDLLKKDWREIVRTHFELSDEEERSLVETHPSKVEKIQKFLLEAAQHIQQGGVVTGKLVKRSPEEQTRELVYGVDINLKARKE